MDQFTGAAVPLSSEGLAAASDKLRVGLPEIWSVLAVETSGCGFLRDRRPQILFERHVFHRETNGQYDGRAPDVSAPSAGGYGPPGAQQYQRLFTAIGLDRAAALRSASWGIGQVMGENAAMVGFADVEAMVSAMMESEDNQLQAMLAYCVHNGLDRALREHRWADFARGYNGRGFLKFAYHTKLQRCFERYTSEGTPDVNVRAAQVYLRYWGIKLSPVDGVMGPDTRRALKRFQLDAKLPETGAVDARVLDSLKARTAGSSAQAA